jgi:Flp pilus assembly protein TadD
MRYALVLSLLIVAETLSAEARGEAGTCANQYSAKLVSLQGGLLISAAGTGRWQAATLNQTICQGTMLKVEPYSRASLVLPNGIVLRMDEGTEVTLQGIEIEKPTLLNLLKGFIHFISRTPRQLEINTPIANAGPEGTEFAIKVDDNNASLWVYEGKVKFFNTKGAIKLKPGEAAQAQAGQAPQAKIDVRPKDAVNWALYYPPILPYPAPGMVVDNGIRSAIDDFRKGQAASALSNLDKLSIGQQSPYFLKVRAAMRLTLGRVELAQQDIQTLLAANPKDADALAIKSVMALTQNRKDEAYQLAQQAVAANPQSATAYSALSYAEQGGFNLDKAQAAADQAAKLAPHDAMTWARKAELELSQGLTSDSQQAAKKAIELDSKLERTQTIQGFAHLINMDADDALISFNKATELDSTAPLARLGLGLAKIRNGDLEDGRRDLEIAAILDPNNSIVRSYLGKAYYEEKRNNLAEDQFNLAKERDPKDPTPYFYEALKKQTENKPIAALKDLQKAKELNDNRAIYRSKQHLDNDLAIRNTSLARIYDDLGFGRRATVEATKSLAIDPTNYSAHRFLSDTYLRLPRHEFAQVSELLQSQLLQPINNNPVQPHQSIKGINNLTGLFDPSFKDFTNTFQRNKPRLYSSGIIGSQNTYGDEIVLSGIEENFSYSAGQFHYETDGFRKNAFKKHDVYNAFLQAAIIPDFNIQFEFRKRESKQGNIRMDLTNNDRDTNQDRTLDQLTGRIGANFSFSNRSKLIGSFIYNDRTETANTIATTPQGSSFDFIHDYRKGSDIEGQYLFDGDVIDSIFGLGFFNVKSKQYSNLKNLITDKFLCNFIFSKPAPCLVTNQNSQNPWQQSDAFTIYNYNQINFPKNITWTIGLSYEAFKNLGNEAERFDKFGQKVNPKIGVQWWLLDNLRLRGVYLKTIKRQLLSDQTIEPTQVAGFNQFYDDFNGSRTTLKGVGLDYNIGSDLLTGIEVTERNIDNEVSKNLESQINAYLNWSCLNSFALSIENQFERYKSTNYNLETNILPINLKYFHDSGFFAHFSSTLVWQRKHSGTEVISTSFPLFGLGIGYRLPKKWGIVSFDIENVGNNKFEYQDLSDRTSDKFNIIQPFLPVSSYMFRVLLNF